MTTIEQLLEWLRDHYPSKVELTRDIAGRIDITICAYTGPKMAPRVVFFELEGGNITKPKLPTLEAFNEAFRRMDKRLKPRSKKRDTERAN